MRYAITYDLGSNETLIREVDAYSMAAARGTAEEQARTMRRAAQAWCQRRGGCDSDAPYTVTGITRIPAA